MTVPRSFGDVIASPSNPGIKSIRSLQRRKIRQQERAFVVEGARAVEDVLAAGIVPLGLYLRDDVETDRIPAVPAGVPLRIVVAKLFDSLTDVPHPQGMLAIVPMLDEPDVPLPESGFSPLVLVIDGVRDPGNLGTLLRSAAGAGVDHVIIGPETVDPYHPRAVRAAMGAHVRVPFSHRSWEAMTPLLEGYETIALADAGGDVVYDQVTWAGSSALIVGGEAFGPTPAAWSVATHRVAIPLHHGVESLNAGVAGSLLLFEAARQRRAAGSAR
jgi:TrmH family RNA methyltransferase